MFSFFTDLVDCRKLMVVRSAYIQRVFVLYYRQMINTHDIC